MYVKLWITATVAVALCPASARAEHDHGGHAGHAGHADPAQAETLDLDLGAGIVLARYETELYAGDYQGVRPTASWRRGRFGISAEVGFYRVTENGARYFGFGDVLAGAGVTLYQGERVVIAAGLPVSLPTGDHTHGLGMGHVMVMPTVVTSFGRVVASVTYGKAVGGEAHHAGHGVWPLIDPMNQQEVAGSLAASLPLAHKLHMTGRVGGALAIGDGSNRVHLSWEAVWTAGRVTTKFELFTGLAADPVVVGGGLGSEIAF